MSNQVCNEIRYPFPDFDGCTLIQTSQKHIATAPESFAYRSNILSDKKKGCASCIYIWYFSTADNDIHR